MRNGVWNICDAATAKCCQAASPFSLRRGIVEGAKRAQTPNILVRKSGLPTFIWRRKFAAGENFPVPGIHGRLLACSGMRASQMACDLEDFLFMQNCASFSQPFLPSILSILNILPVVGSFRENTCLYGVDPAAGKEASSQCLHPVGQTAN